MGSLAITLPFQNYKDTEIPVSSSSAQRPISSLLIVYLRHGEGRALGDRVGIGGGNLSGIYSCTFGENP